MALQSSHINAANLGAAVLDLVADPTKLRSGMAVGKAEALSWTKSTQDALKSAGAAMSQTGANMSLAVTVPVLAAGKAILSTGVDFDTTMRQIVGLTDVTGQEIDGIKDKVLALGGQVGKTPQELAEAFYFVASAGFNANEAMDVLTTAATASAAGLGRTQDVAKVLGLTINAYGKENITAARAADILVAAVKDGTAEADAFAGVLGRVVPTAAVMGVTFDQVAASLAAMTLTGLSADEAATSLNQVLVSLLKPTTEAEKALDGMHLSAQGLRDQLRNEGLVPTLRTLETAFAGNEEASSQVFGNVRALRGVLSLLTLDSDQLNKVFKDSNVALGDLATGFDETEGPARKFARAQANLDAALIKLSDDVIPVALDMVKDLVGFVQAAVDAFEELPPGVRDTVIQALALLAALGPVLLIGGKLVSTVGFLWIGLDKLATLTFGRVVPALTGIDLAAAGMLTRFTALAPIIALVAYHLDILNGIQSNPKGPLQEVMDDTQWALEHPLIPLWFRGIAEGLGLVATEAAAAAPPYTGVVTVMSEEEEAARDAIETHRILAASLPAVSDAYRSAALGPAAYAKAQQEALDKALADQKSYTADALAVLQGFRTDIENAFKAAQDAALDAERTAVAITTKQAELVELDKEHTKRMGHWTKAQSAEWRLRKDQALAELAGLKLHAALIGDDIAKTSKLKSLLASKDMKDGLTSKFPETKAAYKALQASAIAELNRIASEGGPAAKDAAKAVAKYLNANNPSSPLHNTYGWGGSAGREYVQGIADALNKTRPIHISLDKMAAMLRASSPPGPDSPLHEIDHWGHRTGRAWLDPLVSVLDGAAGALHGPLDAAARAFGTPFGAPGLTMAAAGVGLGSGARAQAGDSASWGGGHGPLIGELHVDARGHPDAAGVGDAVKEAVADAIADALRDQATRYVGGTTP